MKREENNISDKNAHVSRGAPWHGDTYGADEGGIHHLHKEPDGRRLVLHHERLALRWREGVSLWGGRWVPPRLGAPPQLTWLVSGVGSISQPFSSTSPSSASVSFFSSSLSK